MAVARRSPRSKAGSEPIEETLVDSLIRENQRLKRQLLRLEVKTSGDAGAALDRDHSLGTIAWRLQRALSVGGADRGTGRKSSPATWETRRSALAPKTATSQETQAKRLAALAVARKARAAKRNQGASPSG